MFGKSIIKKTLKTFANLAGYEITPIKLNSEKIIEDEFREIYNKVKDYTMTSRYRMYALYKAVKYIVNSKIPGDFVECGVWRGGSSMVIAYTLLEMNEINRKIYLYDTFEGMSKPANNDYSISNKTKFDIPSTILKWEKEKRKDYNNWDFSPLSEVKKNILSTGYPKDKIVFVKGKVEDTIPKVMPDKISVLRLDTDWYESTKHELIHLFPILVKNGVLIIDDYAYWAGCKKAVDEYLSNKPILLNRIDHPGRLGIKIE